MNIYRCNSNQTNCIVVSQLPNSFYCKTFSVIEDWSMVTQTLQFNTTTLNVNINDTMVLKLINTVGQWSYFSVYYVWKHTNGRIMNTNNNKLNTSPVTQAFPVCSISQGCQAQLKIRITYVDNDIIKCKFARKE